jgi:feruloyl esterase
MGDGWIRPAQTRLVHDAVLAACDGADGLVDGLISDPVGCKARFRVQSLQCQPGAGADSCLSAAQIKAVQTLHAPHDVGVELANGLRTYPGRGPSGENLPSMGPTGGWNAWWLGQVSPTIPPMPSNSIAWFYGAGAIQYVYARDPKADLKTYSAQQHAARVQEVSALMDSTNPDLSAFHARGGKLIMLENMADYAQSPYAGIAYAQSVKDRLGEQRTAEFFRLYTAPNVDHVGTGGPAHVDMLSALQHWVEAGRAPTDLQLVEQVAQRPFDVKRSRPLCEWPAWPRYLAGDVNAASSFQCVK